MRMPAGYQEKAHTYSDRNCVEAVWIYLAREAGQHRVLPDGRCDIILRFEFDDDRPIGKIEPLIAGPSTNYHMVPLTRGLGFIGLRLRPGSAGMVLGVAMPSIADQVFSAQDAIRIVPALSSLQAPARSIEALVTRLNRFVVDRTAGKSSGTARSLALIDALHVNGGRLSISDLAKMYGIDDRTVRRDIKESTGLSPKGLSMVLQFHCALRLLRDTGLDPASAAAEAGYADQSHMTRMIRKFGGFTPANLPDVTLANLPL